MIMAHVIPHEEAFVRALNGEEVYGCVSDLDSVWYVDLRKKRLFDAFSKKMKECDYTYCIDSMTVVYDGERHDIPAGRYNIVDCDDNMMQVETVEEFNRVTKWC